MSIDAILRQLGVGTGALTSDSRKVQAGSVFVAYPGTTIDGRDYVDAAVARGAVAALVEARGWVVRDHGVPCIAVENLRRRYAGIADSVADLPSQKLRLIGVTGTNGKTSTSTWIAQAFDALNQSCGLIGTLGAGRVGALVDIGNTTPDAAVVVNYLARMVKDGLTVAAMEVSSHALDQHRVTGLAFRIAVFTNLTRDHLDYHATMDAYADAKARLFKMVALEFAIVNADDPAHLGMIANTTAKVIRYGKNTSAEVRLLSSVIARDGITLSVSTPWGQVNGKVPVLGEFNVANLLAVIATLGASGCSAQAIADVLPLLTPVRGRMETVAAARANAPTVVVDYAHTPDALQKALSTLRDVAPGGKLICVVGCGGDRDAGKRAMMGKIAADLADAVWVTSDNPRSEPPMTIIQQIIAGVDPKRTPRVHVQSDRAQAIADAIRAAGANDIVLIAGKGHEIYQEINGVRAAFDDVAVAQACLC